MIGRTTIPPAQVRATAEYLARTVGCYVTEVRGPGQPEQLREIANWLHALLGEADCPGHVSMDHVRYLFRLVEGHLDTISDRNRTKSPKPDPCDADTELDRLRQLVGDEDVDAQWNGVDRAAVILLAEEHYAEAERYRNDRAVMWELLKRAVRTYRDNDEQAMAEWRAESARHEAEVTRLKRLVGDESVGPIWEYVDRHEAIRQATRSHIDLLAVKQQRDAIANQLGDAEADRDIAQANERDLRRRLKRIARETVFESALDTEPLCGAGNEDYPELDGELVEVVSTDG